MQRQCGASDRLFWVKDSCAQGSRLFVLFVEPKRLCWCQSRPRIWNLDLRSISLLCTAARVAASRLSPESLLDQGRFAIFFQQFGLEIKKKKRLGLLAWPFLASLLGECAAGDGQEAHCSFPVGSLAFPSLIGSFWFPWKAPLWTALSGPFM